MASLSGRVRIYSNSAEGAEIMLNVLEQGDLFGEIALLDGSTRTASAAAMERTDLLRIHRAHFLPYVQGQPRSHPGNADTASASGCVGPARSLRIPLFWRSRAGWRSAAGAGRALPQTARARGYGTLSQYDLGSMVGAGSRNDQQAARPLAFRRDSGYRSGRHCDPQLRGAAGAGRLRFDRGVMTAMLRTTKAPR